LIIKKSIDTPISKHIKKADRINVEEPFFEYVTPHKQGEAKFMLTKEEQEFINQ